MVKVKNILVLICLIITKIAGEIPECDFFDTVDLTGSTKFENGSYQYGNILIPKDKVGQYDYILLLDRGKKDVDEHTRGCICPLKSCVRFCCDPQHVLIENERRCEKITDPYKFSSLVNVTLQNATEAEINVLEEFVVQKDFEVPCENHFALDADNEIAHKWTLYENGTLYRSHDSKYFGKAEYCLQPYNLGNGTYKIVPHQCEPAPDLSVYYVYYVRCASTVFLILTTAILLYLPEYRKQFHYKCIILYLTCLTVSFTLLAVQNLKFTSESRTMCYAIAFTGYYAVMAMFLWLLVINYYLWKKFKYFCTKKVGFKQSNIFVWTVAAVLLLISGLVDYFFPLGDKEFPDEAYWKPVFCIYTKWIYTLSWSAMIYYYGPISLLLLINITFFVRMSYHIYAEGRKIDKELSKVETSHKQEARTNFMTFIRFFITAGLIWCVEIYSYLMGGIQSHMIDYITSSQGIIIFLLTIFTKEFFNSIHDRLTGRRKKGFRVGLTKDYRITKQNE